MTPKKTIGLVFLVAVVLALFSSVYVVYEGQLALVLQLGKIVQNKEGEVNIIRPGLHFKLPVINSVRKFDSRIQGFTSKPFSALTSKQTFLEVDYYAKWRIEDPALYFTRTGGRVQQAEVLMEPKINDIIRAEFGKRTSDQIISADRQQIMTTILNASAKMVREEYGIKMIDIRIESVKLPDRVMQSVFKRMASERKQFANNKRAEGLKVAESVQALADQKVIVIKATAQQQAAEIKAKGEKEAANIYAKAYSADPDFYAFYRSLLAYQASFKNKDDILVLKPDGQFFQYFNNDKKKKG